MPEHPGAIVQYRRSVDPHNIDSVRTAINEIESTAGGQIDMLRRQHVSAPQGADWRTAQQVMTGSRKAPSPKPRQHGNNGRQSRARGRTTET